MEKVSTRRSYLESFESAGKKKESLIARLADLHMQINSIEGEAGLEGDADCLDVFEKRMEYISSLLVHRKRIVNRMIGDICESGGFSRKQLAGDLGLDLVDLAACRDA